METITLNHFIAMKPKELRLGQWFVDSYCKHVDGRWEELVDALHALEGRDAAIAIQAVMFAWQWGELPMPKKL